MIKRVLIGLFIVFALAATVYKQYFYTSPQEVYKTAEEAFQKDADLLRLEHLLYWTGLVEEYGEKVGYYPFQNELSEGRDNGLVRISTKDQQQFFDKTLPTYRSYLDMNSRDFFQEFSVSSFVLELEEQIGREIDEKYDIQQVPTRSPIGYYYFVSEDGYLLWTSCITCGVTQISTLLMDGFTPTVNIGSEGMVPNVTKAFTRNDMMNHPIFKQWQSRTFQKEDHIRSLEAGNFKDSKKALSETENFRNGGPGES